MLPAPGRLSAHCAGLLGALLLGHALCAWAQSAITSSGLNTTISANGTTYDITGGTQKGSNLFHSFGQFSVGAGDTANFSNPGALAIANILGRVTGGEISQVFGMIQSTEFGAANLFLINPAGWMFGAGASLNVGGSFHVSTANYIRLSDGVQFDAAGVGDALLTSALPAAFGFLGPTVAPIALDGALLAVPEGQSLSLVGGDVSISGSTLSAPGGKVGIAAVASAGEVTVPDFALGGFSSLGQVTIAADGFGTPSFIDASGVPVFDPNFGNINGGGPGGEIVIRGGRLVVSDSALMTGGYGDLGAGVPTIDVAVSESVALTNSLLDVSGRQIVDTDGFTVIGGGAGGSVVINAGSLTAQGSSFLAGTFGNANGASLGFDINVAGDLVLAGFSGIVAFTHGPGNGSGVRIAAGNMSLTEGSGIASSTFAGGAGGDVMVTTNSGTLLMSGGSISTDTAGDGAGGNVVLSSPAVSLENGAFVSTTTSGNGGGGSVLLSSPSITFDGGASVISQTFGPAAGGDLRLQAGDLTISGGAFVKSDTGGGAPGGNIFVTATGQALISGPGSQISSGGSGTVPDAQAGDISVTARQLTITAGGSVVSGTDFDVAGNIAVSAADSIVISDGGQIVSQAFQTDVGDVTISVPSGSLTMDRGLIQASTSQQGNAGNINVDVGTLSLINGAQIVTNSSGIATGRGGNLTINAATSVSIAGRTTSTPVFAGEVSSGLFSRASQSPDPAARGGGQIAVTTPLLTISDGAKIAAFTPGFGPAGSISLNANTLTLTGGSQVTAASTGAGQGGNITLTGNHIDIVGGARVTAEASSTGNAGTVTIHATGADTLTISGAGSVVSTSTSGDGHGGDVNLVSAGDINISNGGTVSADSLGAGGTGTINVTASDSIIMDQGTISTRAVTSDGGNIKLTAPNVIQLEGSTITTSVESGAGGGGNISIDPQFVLVNNSSIIANAFGGPGGNITIVANNFLASANSVIDASSALSTPGVIEIRSPENNVESSIAQLPAAFLDAAALLRGLCTARRTGAPSSFVVAGRGGVPLDADGYLPIFGAASTAMADVDGPARLASGESRLPLALLLANTLDCAR
jgi:filamentous hemagglutinin family protein